MKGTVIVQLSSYMSIRLLLIMVTVRPQYGLLLRLSRLVGRGGSSCEAKTVCWVRHQDFPGGHPSQFHSGPSALNCRVHSCVRCVPLCTYVGTSGWSVKNRLPNWQLFHDSSPPLCGRRSFFPSQPLWNSCLLVLPPLTMLASAAHTHLAISWTLLTV